MPGASAGRLSTRRIATDEECEKTDHGPQLPPPDPRSDVAAADTDVVERSTVQTSGAEMRAIGEEIGSLPGEEAAATLKAVVDGIELRRLGAQMADDAAPGADPPPIEDAIALFKSIATDVRARRGRLPRVSLHRRRRPRRCRCWLLRRLLRRRLLQRGHHLCGRPRARAGEHREIGAAARRHAARRVFC